MKVGSPAEAAEKIVEIARSLSAKTIILKNSRLLKDAEADSFLKSKGFAAEWAKADKERFFAADMGVSEPAAALAESGTLVELVDPERGDLASLVPPVHVAIFEETKILDSLDAFFRQITPEHGSAGLPRRMTLITGPSRTADIEQSLTMGVHGPKELFAVVISLK